MFAKSLTVTVPNTAAFGVAVVPPPVAGLDPGWACAAMFDVVPELIIPFAITVMVLFADWAIIVA